MKRIFERIKNDPLCINAIYTRTSIDRSTFLTLYLLRMIVLFCLYGIVSSIVMFPVDFLLIYNLIKARLSHIDAGIKRRKAMPAILALVHTLFIYLSFTYEYTYIYHFSPRVLLGYSSIDDSILNKIILSVNLLHVICGVTALISVIALAWIKGKGGTTEGIAVKPALPASVREFLAALFRFKGSVSRIGFVYLNTCISLISFTGFAVFFVLLLVSAAKLLSGNLLRAVLFFGWSLLMLLMFAALTVRRLHDLKLSGWWTVPYFVLVFLYAALSPLLLQFVIRNVLSSLGTELLAKFSIYNLYITPVWGLIGGIVRFCSIAAVVFLYFYPGGSETSWKFTIDFSPKPDVE